MRMLLWNSSANLLKFVNRDMILFASLMQNTDQQSNENTLLQFEEEEKQNKMETDVPSLVEIPKKCMDCYTLKKMPS